MASWLRPPGQASTESSGRVALHRIAARRVVGNWLTGWITAHLQSFFFSLGRLARAPTTSLATASVIGISLTLPAGLYVLLDNVAQLARSWEGPARISIFLKRHVDDTQARRLGAQLTRWPGIADVELITRQQALAEYRELSGFKHAMDVLGENPLPAVLVVKPAGRIPSPAANQAVVGKLEGLAEVEVARMDMQWVHRLHAIVELVEQTVLTLACLLALAVLLIVGNTIRLEIENRRAEIEIARLFGATKAFIRRPFLYSGLLYGLIGGILAWCLVSLSFAFLRQPVRKLADLYNSNYDLSILVGREVLLLLVISAALGTVGAALAVARYLKGVETPTHRG